MLTAKRARELLDYNPKTGIFHWKVSKGAAKKGSIAGSRNEQKYVKINVGGRSYKAHRLARLITYGRWPKVELDHKNRKRADNRLANLREATRGQNMTNKKTYKNNTNGIQGVCHRANTKKPWRVYISAAKTWHHLGYFTDFGEAVRVRKRAELEFFGAFATASR